MKIKKTKRKLKYKNIFLALFFLIAVIYSVIKLSNFWLNKAPSNQSVNPSEKTESQEYHLSLIMAGDNLIHDTIIKDASKKANYQGYDFTEMYELVKPLVKDHELAYYNQETIIGGQELGLSGYPAFNSPYELGEAMIDTGFNLVSLATNHTLDKGTPAVINSNNYWNQKTNVLTAGSYLSTEERNKIDIREVNNITYTMLNYTYGTNGITKEYDYLVNIWPVNTTSTTVTQEDVDRDETYQAYKEQVRQDIEKVRDQVDLLIVAMHWGVEYNIEPTAYQLDAANFLASLDVDIIIGTHPHVIEPLTWIDDTLVIYSLGNFISAHEVINMDNRVGLLTSIDITKTIEDNKTSISLTNLSNELIYTYYNNYTDFKIIPFSQIDETYLQDYQTIYEKYKKIVTKYNSDIKVIPCN